MNRSFSYYADGVLSKILGVVLAAVTFSYYVRGANLILFSLVFGFCASEVYLFFIDKKPTERKVPTEIEYSLCGIGIENYNDIKEGDIIEAFKMVEVERK